ncbi:MAG: Flp pilus assembly complex ATPase component TadA [Nitrospinae bacterium]|nr:Flp pilus assembly complex ATPase component TadA [Nitrospinota bacterium]
MEPQSKVAKEQDMAETRLLFLERLKHITHQIHSAENIDDILLHLKESIISLFDADRITIYAVDKIKREIYSKYKVGDVPHEIRVPISKQSVAGYVAATGSVISINDAYSDLELLAIFPDLKFDKSWDQKTGYRTKQILAHPIMYDKYLLGVIQLINKKSGGPFTAQDRSGMQEIADVLGLAFYNYQKRTVKYKTRFDYLVHQNIISKADLEKAMDEARARKWDVTEVLLKVTKISKQDLGKSLSAYYNMKFMEFDDSYNPPMELLDRLKMKNPFKLMERNGWVPYRMLEGGNLLIVCEDPTDHVRLGDIQLLVKDGKFELAVSLRDDILRMISKMSGKALTAPSGNIDSVLDEIEVGREQGAEAEESSDDTGMAVQEADSGVIKLMNQVIMDAYSKNVSDIHVETYPGKANTVIRFRIDGDLQEYKQIPANWKRAIVARIKIMSNLNIAERRLPQDGKIQLKLTANKTIELRVATVPTFGGNEDAVMRILAASEPLPLDKLNLSPRNYDFFTKAVEKPYGIFLVVGPTGSGKTTTLHSVLGYLNKPDTKIWTAEDPVEITQVGLRQVQMQADINLTFATALRAFLRADPDIIMIGEMRDHETANMGIEASLTGHLVFSTLHTNSAPETITRLIDLGIDPFNFADALLGVLAQRLVRTLCPFCKEKYKPTQEALDIMKVEYGEKMWEELNPTVDSVNMCKPKGCQKCGNTGFKGRTGLHEVLVMDMETKRLIQSKALVDLIRESAIRHGMRTLKQDGIWKVLKGDTTIEKVREVCSV